MLRWSKFFYMTSVPTHNELKSPRLEPTPTDFTTAMKMGGRGLLADDPKKGKVFSIPKTFSLPKALAFTPNNLKTLDRSAGTAANQRAAAATAWVLANATSDFVHGPVSWTGTGKLRALMSFIF